MEFIAKGELPINVNEALSLLVTIQTWSDSLWEKLQISKGQILKQHNSRNEKAVKGYKHKESEGILETMGDSHFIQLLPEASPNHSI